MRKLLFIEPDAARRGALEAALACARGQWEMRFAAGERAAQEALSGEPWDVVVADVVSAHGKTILSEARKTFPEMVRIGVLDAAEPRLPHVSLVHQFISRPVDPLELQVAVERACKLKELLEGELISRTVGALGNLPSAPSVYFKLVQKLNEPDASVEEVAEIVSGDIAISARLLQLANSAIFRTSREIATVKMAASFLGLAVVQNLVLASEVYRAFGGGAAVPGFSVEALQTHSRIVAGIASGMGLPKEEQDSAMVGALLHDVGKLVLASKMPSRFSRLLARASEENQPLYRVEEELWGITHAEIGAYLLGLWGLPIGITEAVAYHHGPGRVPHYRFDALAAVHVANLLAHECEGATPDIAATDASLDLALLREMGVADRIPRWRQLAQQVTAQQGVASPA